MRRRMLKNAVAQNGAGLDGGMILISFAAVPKTELPGNRMQTR